MENLSDVLTMVDEAKLFQNVKSIEGIRHPITNPDGMKNAIKYIESEFNRYGYEVNRIPFDIEGFSDFCFNIEAKTDDTDSSQFLITSHFDTIYNSPGADDSASAVSVMLEVARVAKELNIDSNMRFVCFNFEERHPVLEKNRFEFGKEYGFFDKNFKPTSHDFLNLDWELTMSIRNFVERGHKSPLDALFSKFEDQFTPNQKEYFNKRFSHFKEKKFPLGSLGLTGSGKYVEHLSASKIRVNSVLNLETVGYIDNSKNSQQFPLTMRPDQFAGYKTDKDFNRANFIAIISDHIGQGLGYDFFKEAQNDGIELPSAAILTAMNFGQISRTLPDLLRSDHAHFWKKGIPAIMVTDTANFRNPFFHTPGDVLETLDFNFMKKVAQTSLLTIKNRV